MTEQNNAMMLCVKRPTNLRRASADRCRRYAAIKNKGTKTVCAPSKFVPRRRTLDEELTCFSLDTASDFAFETSNCLVFSESASSSVKSLVAGQGKVDCAAAEATHLPSSHQVLVFDTEK